MEKQVHSNTEEKTQSKFNKITVFLAKFLFGDNFDVLKKVGYIDSYTSDPEIMKILTLAENQRLLFLLFRNKKLGIQDMQKIIFELAIMPVQVVFSYELVNDYFMIVIDFPEKYTLDYDHVVKGRYSKLSDGFKDKFPVSRDVYNSNNVRIGKEYTIYYEIFNKTEWLKNYWMDRLGLIELDEKLELWQSPDKKDLEFDVKTILNN